MPGVIILQRCPLLVAQEVEIPRHSAPGYAEFGHKVGAIRRFSVGRALPDHLNHAPDAVILGP